MMTAPLYNDAEGTFKKQLFGSLHPSKLSLRRVNALKGLGHRDEPFLIKRSEFSRPKAAEKKNNRLRLPH